MHVFSSPPFNVNDITLSVVYTHSKQLQDLMVSNTKHITDTGLLAVVTECKELKSLSLRSCKSLTTDGIVACAPKCTQLLRLELSLFGMGIRVWSFFTHARQLCSFTGSLPWGVVLASAVYWTELRELELLGGITDRVLCAIARNCPQLRRLELFQNGMLRDSSMVALSKHCRQLEYVVISSGSGIMDDGVGALARESQHVLPVREQKSDDEKRGGSCCSRGACWWDFVRCV